MLNNLIETMKEIPQSCVAVFIAVMGGVANFLMIKKEERSLFSFLTMIFIAGFAGFLTFKFCCYLECSKDLASIASGISGLSGEAVLKLYKKTFLKKITDKLN